MRPPHPTPLAPLAARPLPPRPRTRPPMRRAPRHVAAGPDADTLDREDDSPPPPTLDVPPPAPDETSPARAPFHRALAAAAAAGDRAAADAVLADMSAAGLPPGPRAVHAAVVAAARAGDADGALDAMRAAHAQGLRPLPESYVALIIAFTTVRDAAAARAVLASMQRAAPDARPGWLALCAGLFRAGLGDDAAAALARGKRDGWTPDADLYALYMDWLVKTPEGAATARSVFTLDMPRAGVRPDTRHANALLAADAAVAPHIGEATLAAMQSGEFGPGCRPDHASHAIYMEALLAVCDAATDEVGDAHRALDLALHGVLRACLHPDKRIYAAVVRARLSQGRTLDAASAFRRMAALGSPGDRTAYLPDAAVTDMVLSLAGYARPTDLLDVVAALADDGRPLPPEVVAPLPSGGGHTVIASWLPNAIVGARASRRPAGLLRLDEGGGGGDGDSAADAPRTIDGVLVDSDGAAIWEVGGPPIPVSRMTRVELAAEVTARGLGDAEGATKSELYSRVQVARAADKAAAAASNEVTSAADIAEARAGKAAARDAREASALGARAAAEADLKRNVTWTEEWWVDGVIVETRTYEAPPPPTDEIIEGVGGDDDDDGGGGARGAGPPRAGTAAAAAFDLATVAMGDGDDDDDMLEWTARQVADRALLRKKGGGGGAGADGGADDDDDDDDDGVVPDDDDWGEDDAGDEAGPWLPADARLADVALGVLLAVETCGGAPSPTDLASLARAAAADRDGPLAAAVADRLTVGCVDALGPRAAGVLEADLLRAVGSAGAPTGDGASGDGRGDGARALVLAGLDRAGLGDTAAAVDAAVAAAAAREEVEAAAAAAAAAAARASPARAPLGESSESEVDE